MGSVHPVSLYSFLAQDAPFRPREELQHAVIDA